MAQKVKKKGRKNFIMRLCVFAFVAYAAVLLIDMQVTLSTRKQELEALRVGVENQRLVNKELERQLAAGVDDAYIEREARAKLDYVYPEERVFIDISGS